MVLREAIIAGILLNVCVALPQQNAGNFISVVEPRVDFIANKVIELLEKIKSQMKDGIPDHNIPPLDPFVKDDVSLGPIKLGNIGKLNVAKFDNVELNGLHNFNLENVKTNIFSLELNLTLHFPLLSADGKYDVDGIIASVFPIFGKGNFQVYLRDTRAGGKAKLSVKDRRVSLKTLKLHSSTERIDTSITGLLGGGSLGEEMNKLVNKGAKQLIDQLKPRMSDMVSEFVRLRLNDGLKDFDIGSIAG